METSQLYGAGLFAWALGLVLVRQKCCSPNDVAANSSTIPESFIQEFIERGVVVIPGVLSPGEVDLTRRKFHEYLAKNGCDYNDLMTTAGSLARLSTTAGAGGILDIFYQDWKLKINEHPRVVSVIVTLLENTYAKCIPNFVHPYGKFISENVYMYIDRVCFRVPESISNHFFTKKRTLQRSLTPHLDCCPQRLYNSQKDVPKWRPIQAFVALTDSLNPNEGGFEAHPGFHIGFDEWVQTRHVSPTRVGKPRNTEPPCVGDFTPIRPIEDKNVLRGVRHIPCRAGDMVCWDIRIPHANSKHNSSEQTREVIYIGVLPGTDMNRQYAVDQLNKFMKGEVPSDQWHEHTAAQPCYFEFSELGRKMMTIDPYC